jgi:hypothetical protein
MILETESGSIRPHSVGNSVWKRLRTCRKTDYCMNEFHQDAIMFIMAGIDTHVTHVLLVLNLIFLKTYKNLRNRASTLK